MPIISLRILTNLINFSIIQFMNTHMINQILPFLLTESTPQGIPQKDTVITILTGHPSLNPRKLPKRQPQEQVENIIIHQAVIILPISKDHVKDRRNNDLVGHSSNKPVRQPHRSSHPTSEVAKHRQLTPHDPIPSLLQLLISKARTEHRSIHPYTPILQQNRQSEQITERRSRNQSLLIFPDNILRQFNPFLVITQIQDPELIIRQMLPLRSQAHLHQIRRLVNTLQPGEPDNLRHTLIIPSRMIHIPRLLLIQDMSIFPNQDPIHSLSNHRISSLHGPPLQGTAYQGTDTRSPPIRTYCHTSLQPPNCRKRVIILSKSTIYTHIVYEKHNIPSPQSAFIAKCWDIVISTICRSLFAFPLPSHHQGKEL